MNLVNDEALQEIKQQLSEIKISTSKKNENFAFSSFACANPSDNQKSKSVKYDELTNNNKSSKNILLIAIRAGCMVYISFIQSAYIIIYIGLKY